MTRIVFWRDEETDVSKGNRSNKMAFTRRVPGLPKAELQVSCVRVLIRDEV